MTGATDSMLATRIPSSEMRKVKTSARIGSLLAVVALKTLRNGMMSSRAIACSRRAAPGHQYNAPTLL